MTVTPLAIDADARLEAWSKWCQQFDGEKSIPGVDWHKAASNFFERFVGDTGEMFPDRSDWMVVNGVEQTAKLTRHKKCGDLVFKFFQREPGEFGVRLHGTVEA